MTRRKTDTMRIVTDETVSWDEATDKLQSKEQLEMFIDSNMASQYRNFKEYFDAYVMEHNLLLPDIMKRSNIDKGYFYNIINGDRKPKRDKIICLCVGAGMDVRRVNRALRLGRFSKLDPKDERDLRIKFAISNGVKNVVDINLMLEEAGLDILK